MAKKGTPQAEPSMQSSPATTESSGNGKYTVVARRYRPKTFAELVGQSTVAQALLSAIESNRVGHAYLFTGARGVGKTSTARIFAKALNASAEADGKFDPNSETALAIDAGEDMDVIEIDGASNRGIDEIRQLRANAAVRPSSSRYKIYIIDEVHMLTTQAFNALLKTLEEPPGHVKFIFCTTDPEKIPITVLSRCQRFDFPPVQTEQIYERLKFICKNEGTEADEGALRLIARRAAGSMRDSQSLLEQLLSFGGNEITADVVHAMLGTADETRLATFAARLIERDAAGALRELEAASSEGVDVGQLAEQLLGYLRDMMAISVGGSADLIRTANPNSADQLREWGKTWGTMTLLSALQLLDEAIVRMRHSVQSRVLLEVALVQICNLQDLQSLSELVKAFANQQAGRGSGLSPVKPPVVPQLNRLGVEPANVDSKKKVELNPESPEPNPILTPDAMSATIPRDSQPISSQPQVVDELQKESFVSMPAMAEASQPQLQVTNQSATPKGHEPPAVVPKETVPTSSSPGEETFTVPEDRLAILRETATKLGGFAEQCARMAVRVEAVTQRNWKVCLSREGSIIQNYFQMGDNGRRLTQAMKLAVGRDIHLEYLVTDEPSPHVETAAVMEEVEVEKPMHTHTPSVPQAQLIRNAMGNPLIKQFMDMFDGAIVRVDPVQIQTLRPHVAVSTPSTADVDPILDPDLETADTN